MTHKRTEPYVAYYEHRYRCGCTLPPGANWQAGWIVERSEVENPQFLRKSHYQLDNDRGCNRYLRFVATTGIKGTRQVEIPVEDAEWGELELTKRFVKSGVPTGAIMWCGETRKWYYGKCRHDIQLSAADGIPFTIRKAILDENRDKMVDANCYGANCAEVQCVAKAYAGGRRANDLTGCRFMARNVSTGPISACGSCSSWIKALKGSYATYRAGADRKFV